MTDPASPSRFGSFISNRTRNYSKIYCEIVSERENVMQAELKKKMDNRTNDFAALIARLRINKLMVKHIKRRLKTRFHSVRKTVENLSEPLQKVPEWSDHLGSQSFCDICKKPGLREVVMCSTCNVIYHCRCYQNSKIRVGFSSVAQEIEHDDGFTCYMCDESAAYEVSRRQMDVEYLKANRIKEEKKRVLCRIIYTYFVRKRFLRLKAGMTIAQSMFRRKIERKRFVKWKRRQLHVIVVEVHKLPSYFTTGTVTITIIDPMKQIQILRFDKREDKCYDEGFLIPGISLNVLMVVTISDANGVIYGQTKCSLKDRGSSENLGGFHSLDLLKMAGSGRITWPPLDIKEDGASSHLTVPNSHTIASRAAERAAITAPQHDIYEIVYAPISTLSSMCTYALAPPLDILRRPPDNYMTIQKGAPGSDRRASRYWLVMAEMKLYFYQNYGDCRPRFVMGIKDSTAFISGDLTAVRLTLLDKRTYLFEFENKSLSRQFEFSVTESQRNQQGDSVYIKGKRYEATLRPFT